ncbi:MAG: SLBB domain-containing protein [Phormidesmis sp.]
MVKVKTKWRRMLPVRLQLALVVSATELVLVSAVGHQALAAEPVLPTFSVPTAAATVASSALSDEYPLGAGDAVAIDIFNVPEYSGSQQVTADGSLNLPVVGLVSVSGLTLREAGEVISRAYSSELRYPEVTVVLETPRPLRVAIAGEVAQPGLYTLSPENGAQFPTVAQALQAAGGVTQAANLRQVQLRRTKGVSQAAQTVSLDLWALLNNGDVRQDVALRDGDAIVIGETSTVDIAETGRLSASNLAANIQQEMVVAVVGEVARPGAYEFGGEAQTGGRTTVTQVVQTAGGIKPSADIRNIQVRRQTRSGNEQVIDLDFWQLLQDGDISQDLVLQQGDTVIVPMTTEATPSEVAQLTAANFSPDEVTVNVVGEVERPGVLEVAPDTTLNQAILAAGGFNRRATETVELIRLNPNGSVTQREVEVSLETGIDPEGNPLILNNDVIVVGRNGRARFNDAVDSTLSPFTPLLAPLGLLFNLF